MYQTQLGDEEAYLYILVEHQSTPDKLMAFRVLKYTCNIMEAHFKKYKKLPLVYPFVIYHADKSYPHSTDLRHHIAAPQALVDQYFLKPFHLIDLGQIEDKELKQHAWIGVMEFALKHIYAKNILIHMEDIGELMRQITLDGGKNFISIVLQYVLERGQFKPNEKNNFYNFVNQQISQEMGDNIMTLGEILRAEGRQEGIQQGIQQGKQNYAIEVAARMLGQGATLEYIASITGLSLEKVKELKARQ